MKGGCMFERKEKDIYEALRLEDRIVIMKDIQALKKATEQRKKANPNLTDIDAADYYAQLCVDYLRGK